MPNHPQTPKSDAPFVDKPLFSPAGTVALVVGMTLGFFVSQLVGMYVGGRLLLAEADQMSVADVFYLGSSDGTIISFSILITFVLLTIMTGAIIRLQGGDIKRYLAIKRFSLVVAAAMFGLLILFLIASQALTYFIDAAPLDFVDPLYDSVSSIWLLVLAMVIIAPIYEELIFRGLLWSAIAEQVSAGSKTRGEIVASLVTSLIFASIHLQYGIYEISTIMVLALIFCYARAKSGSLVLPIVLHIINNGLAMWQYVMQVS